MPELPEVETVKNILEPAIKNKTIDYIDVFYDRLVQSDLITFKNELKNRTILYLSRYGKYLFIHLDNDLVIITHLRMEGKFRTAKDYSSARIKHTSMIFYFKDGTALAFDDTRKFGLMYLSNENEYKEILKLCNLEYLDLRYKGKNIGKNAGTLSGGEKTRIKIARALANKNADIYLFDEISAGIDSNNLVNIFNNIEKFLSKQNKIRIYVDHSNYIKKQMHNYIIIN